MKKHYLSIAVQIKSIFPKDVLDWFLWNKFIGVDHFYILDDGSEPPVAEVLEPYLNDITFVEIENLNKMRLHKEIIREFHNRYASETDWMAFLDDDEYLFPLIGKNIKDFLKTIEHRNALQIQWRVFGPEGRMSPLEENEIILDQYKVYQYSCQVKQIVNCNLVERLSLPKLCDQHTTVRENVVDVFGEEVEFTDLVGENGRWRHWLCGTPYADVRTHYPFIINHYAYKSLEHIEYRLFNRGAIQRKDTLEFLAKRCIKDLVKFSNPKHTFQANNSMRVFNFEDHLTLRKEYIKFYEREMGI